MWPAIKEVLKDKILYFNIVLGILLICIGAFVLNSYLMAYTKHGESITVPDLRGLTLDEIDLVLKSKGLTYGILDSAYRMERPPRAILDQDPKPFAKVKENRKIYLTINAEKPPLVRVPSLKDKSLRQASMELESWGLRVGELIYKPDLARNAVLEMQLRNKTLDAGTKIPKGTIIDLVLGDGLGSTSVEVPDLRGRSLEEAKFVLINYSLNSGFVRYDETVTDSFTAVIYRQMPAAGENTSLKMGEAVDMFLTQEWSDSLLLMSDSLQMDNINE